MEGSKRQRSMTEWAKTLACKYDIFPSTVLEIYDGMVGEVYRNNRPMSRKQRTEEFLELYFQGVKGE